MTDKLDVDEEFEQYSLIRLADWYREYLRETCGNRHVLLDTPFFIYLGEILNLRGHCVVAQHGNKGRIISGFHTENFENVPDDEL
jgi:hypothetical protein